MPKEVTLYECSHAIVRTDRIKCEKGYNLTGKAADGGIGIRQLARGDTLACEVCQRCPDFDSMGPPIPKEEKGWRRKLSNFGPLA